MRGFILFIFFFTTGNLYPQFNSGWEMQNYFSYTGSVNDLIYFPSNKIVAVGDYGEIYYSENGGIDMLKIPSGLLYHLRALTFRDSLSGFASGHGGSILKTTDGGKKWESLSSGVTDNLFDIEINGNYIIAVGEKGKILKSTDEGQTWSLKHFNSSYYLLAVKFFNKDTGNAVGSEGVILRTTNAGETWFQQSSVPIPDVQLIDMDVSGSNGVICGDSTVLLYSSNDGNTWERSIVDTNYIRTLYRIRFYDDLNIIGLGDALVKSTDGGASFDIDYYTVRIRALSLISADSVYTGRPKRIESFGLSNYPYRYSFPFNSANILSYTTLTPIDEENCWVGGQQYEYSWQNSITYKTSNGGDNWSYVNTDTNSGSTLINMCFLDRDTGFKLNYYSLAGRNIIYKTINGGQNWSIFKDTASYYTSDIQIYNDTLYYMHRGTIRRYSLEGNFVDTLANPFDLGSYQGLIKFMVVDDSTIYGLSDARREMFRTYNKGRDWIKLIRYSGGSIYDFHFINSETGFLVGAEGSIYKTTYSNLLETIETGNPNTNLAFYSVWMSDIYNIYVGGSRGVIYSSHDGGVTWTLNHTNITSDITRIRFINSETGWAAGDNGVILKTTTGGSYWENESNEIPVKYVLYQNYPNPFNPVTTISFDIPDDIGNGSIRTRLVVYDVTGREVRIIVDQDLQASSYSYSFDASTLSSGVYFYKLTAGSDFAQTKKMVLIR